MLCRRAATLCAVLSVAAHWARFSKARGDATAEWYVPNEASAETTEAREAIFLKLNNILTVGCFTMNDKEDQEEGQEVKRRHSAGRR